MRWSEIEKVPCPVAQAMAVIGDSWTVLILRDALRGATKFDEFQASTARLARHHCRSGSHISLNTA